MLSRVDQLLLLFCPAIFTFICLWGAVQHLFELGKSKTGIKKERKSISPLKKLLLIGYAEKSKYHTAKAKRFCCVYWGYVMIMLVCIVLWLLSALLPAAGKFTSICVLAKLVVFDIPVNIYGFVMTKHDSKHGGVTWVWTKNE